MSFDFFDMGRDFILRVRFSDSCILGMLVLCSYHSKCLLAWVGFLYVSWVFPTQLPRAHLTLSHRHIEFMIVGFLDSYTLSTFGLSLS